MRKVKLLLLELFWTLTRCYLRIRGAEVGRGVKCNGFPFVRIRKGGRLIIEDGVNINAHPRWNAHVSKGSTNLFVGEGATLRIEENAGLSGSRIVAMDSITIGPESMIGAGCLVCDSDMHEIPLGTDKPIARKPISIGTRVFIGAQTIILKGVTIGKHSVVGAGSVVSRSIEGDCIAAGNPARVVKQTGEDN